MKSAFNKEVVRSITKSAGRFVAIAIISLLGAGFFAGLRMAPPDMRLAGDEYFDATNTYDISVACTLGLDDESLDILSDVEGVGEVMPAYRADAMVKVGESSYAASIESLPEAAARSDTSDGVHAVSKDENYLNRLILVEGSWPTSAKECVVGIDAATPLGLSIGDSITLEKSTSELDDAFMQTEFTVTGLVRSPLYINSSQMGTTQLGTGSIELYAYVPFEAFDTDMPYSIAYLTAPTALDKMWDSEAYDQAVASVRDNVIAVAGTLADERYQAVKDALHEQIVGVIQEMSVSLGWADDVEWPTVYVLDRTKNPGAVTLSSDAEGIAQIATFLPFMFFLVAALVSLTSMTRMVDEERLDIGTHKALGYGRSRITSKYLIYGALASGVGSVMGIVALGKLLPWFILTSYDVTYDVPIYPLPLDPGVTAWALGLSIGITAIATWAAASASLRERPAALMLPRVPKAGKRIFLEHIRPLWQRFTFSQKVTARNLLRYKRRFFMAVVGVAGCTALLMIGFGLRDAIGGIIANQYEQLMNYDVAVRLDDDISNTERDQVEELRASSAVESSTAVCDFTMIAEGAQDDMRIEVVVPSDSQTFPDFVVLRNRESGQALAPEGDRIVLTEKAANVLGASVGDEIALFDENDVGDKEGEPHMFHVGGIAENYLGHYAYIAPQEYRETFGEEPEYDLLYIKLAPEADASAFGDAMLSIEGVSTVSFVVDKMTTYEDMLDVMNKLIYVVVALSAALAFVVLYNLTNININERIREIATLKVLGFTKREVSVYIFREIIVMALIGALAGCIVGGPMTFYIAEAAETANMMFGRTIEPLSYVLSFVITMVFAAIVAFCMRPKLAKVNMVESLKSVE